MIGDYAFAYCSSLTGVLDIHFCETIGDHAFEECSGIEKLIFNSYAKSIGSYAFFKCTGLAGSIDMPYDLTTIKEYTFYGCTKIEEVYMKVDLERIEKYAFCDCTSLIRASYYHGIKFIGEKAFYNCIKMRDTLNLPNQIETIEELAFGNIDFKTVKFEGEKINCPKNVFTCNPIIITSRDYKDSDLCGLTIPQQTPKPTKSPTPKKSNKGIVIPLAVSLSILGVIIIGCLIWFLRKKYCEDCCVFEKSSDEIRNRYSYEDYNIVNNSVPTHFKKVENWDDPFDIV